MKTLTTFAIAVMCTWSTAVAQKTDIGLMAGAGLSILDASSDYLGEYKASPAFQINLQVRQTLTERIGLRAEPGFARRGANLNYQGGTSGQIDLNYIHLPVLLTYQPAPKVSFMAGPEVAYLVSSFGQVADFDRVKLDNEDDRLDIGVNAGLLYDLSQKVQLGLRFYRGFLSTSGEVPITDENGNVTDYLTNYNQSLSLTAAYKFN